jgi:hypothetical protein
MLDKESVVGDMRQHNSDTNLEINDMEVLLRRTAAVCLVSASKSDATTTRYTLT